MSVDQVRQVPADQWRDAVRGALQEGYRWFCLLTGADGIADPGPAGAPDPAIEVICRLVDPGTGAAVRLLTRVPREPAACRLDSVSDLVAGAGWYQRETRDQFGVIFVGGDPAPLILHREEAGAIPALRKEVVLAERADTPWPGAAEPGAAQSGAAEPGAAEPGAAEQGVAESQARRRRSGAGRRQSAPGVPDPQLWQRIVRGEPVDPAEIAASVSGGRTPRRSPR